MISIRKVTLFGFLSLSPLFIISETVNASTLVASPFSPDFSSEKDRTQSPCSVISMIDFPHLQDYMARNRLTASAPEPYTREPVYAISAPLPKKRPVSLTWIDLALMDLQLADSTFLRTRSTQNLKDALSKAQNLASDIYKEMLDTYRPEYPITPQTRAAAYDGKRKLFIKTQKLMTSTKQEAEASFRGYYNELMEEYNKESPFIGNMVPKEVIETVFEARLSANIIQEQHDLVNAIIFKDFTHKRTVPALWNRLAQMYVCYENFSALYWKVEAALLHESLLGTERGQDLWTFWHVNGHGAQLRKTMSGFMKRHFMIYAVKDEKISTS